MELKQQLLTNALNQTSSADMESKVILISSLIKSNNCNLTNLKIAYSRRQITSQVLRRVLGNADVINKLYPKAPKSFMQMLNLKHSFYYAYTLGDKSSITAISTHITNSLQTSNDPDLTSQNLKFLAVNLSYIGHHLDELQIENLYAALSGITRKTLTYKNNRELLVTTLNRLSPLSNLSANTKKELLACNYVHNSYYSDPNITQELLGKFFAIDFPKRNSYHKTWLPQDNNAITYWIQETPSSELLTNPQLNLANFKFLSQNAAHFFLSLRKTSCPPLKVEFLEYLIEISTPAKFANVFKNQRDLPLDTLLKIYIKFYKPWGKLQQEKNRERLFQEITENPQWKTLQKQYGLSFVNLGNPNEKVLDRIIRKLEAKLNYNQTTLGVI